RRAAVESDFIAGGVFLAVIGKAIFIDRVDHHAPLEMFFAGQDKRDQLIVRVDQEQKSLIANRFTFKAEYVDRIAAQEHSETARKRRRPIFIAHLVAAWVEPHHVLDL